jgi:hypothetical protein
MKEYILCAAIWYKNYSAPVHTVKNISEGVVLCGYRHCNIIGQLHSLVDGDDIEMRESEQGFLTSKNRFVDRIEGARIALASNQIEKLKYGSKLYSEDLY